MKQNTMQPVAQGVLQCSPCMAKSQRTWGDTQKALHLYFILFPEWKKGLELWKNGRIVNFYSKTVSPFLRYQQITNDTNKHSTVHTPIHLVCIYSSKFRPGVGIEVQ